MISEKNRIEHWKISLIMGLFILDCIIFSVAGSSFLSDYSPAEQNAAVRLQSSSKEHTLGMDAFGRDMLSRTLHGEKTTLVSTVSALTVTLLLIGIFIGLLTGMHHDTIIDIVFMRLIDVLMSFPFIVLAMVVTALFVVAAVWWVPYCPLPPAHTIHPVDHNDYAFGGNLKDKPAAMILLWNCPTDTKR